MPRRNLYEILGVASNADPEEIKRAYRHAAFDAHPDVGGRADPERFHELHDAYEVLRDPARRSAYDRTRVRTTTPITHRTLVRDRPGLEPIEARYRSLGPLSALRLVAILTPDEAASGCEVSLELPLSARCPRCGGRTMWCPQCDGLGVVNGAVRVALAIPSGVDQGDLVRLDLEDISMTLMLRIVIQ